MVVGKGREGNGCQWGRPSWLHPVCGAWAYASRQGFVSRAAFLVPKPGGKWRIIIDLSHLNNYSCVRKRIQMGSFMGLWHVTRTATKCFRSTSSRTVRVLCPSHDRG